MRARETSTASSLLAYFEANYLQKSVFETEQYGSIFLYLNGQEIYLGNGKDISYRVSNVEPNREYIESLVIHYTNIDPLLTERRSILEHDIVVQWQKEHGQILPHRQRALIQAIITNKNITDIVIIKKMVFEILSQMKKRQYKLLPSLHSTHIYLEDFYVTYRVKAIYQTSSNYLYSLTCDSRTVDDPYPDVIIDPTGKIIDLKPIQRDLEANIGKYRSISFPPKLSPIYTGTVNSLGWNVLVKDKKSGYLIARLGNELYFGNDKSIAFYLEDTSANRTFLDSELKRVSGIDYDFSRKRDKLEYQLVTQWQQKHHCLLPDSFRYKIYDLVHQDVINPDYVKLKKDIEKELICAEEKQFESQNSQAERYCSELPTVGSSHIYISEDTNPLKVTSIKIKNNGIHWIYLDREVKDIYRHYIVNDYGVIVKNGWAGYVATD